MNVWVGGHNLKARRRIEKLLPATGRRPTGAVDAAFIAPETVGEAVYFAGKLRNRLRPAGQIWVVCASRESQGQVQVKEVFSALVNNGFRQVGHAAFSVELTCDCYEPLAHGEIASQI